MSRPSASPQDRGYQTVSKALAEAYRVLKRGGYFVHLSCAQPLPVTDRMCRAPKAEMELGAGWSSWAEPKDFGAKCNFFLRKVAKLVGFE